MPAEPGLQAVAEEVPAELEQDVDLRSINPDEPIQDHLPVVLPGSVNAEDSPLRISPPRTPNDEDVYKQLAADLADVSCDWPDVTAIFLKYNVSDSVLHRILKESAQKLGFWVPNEKGVKALSRVVRHKLAESSLSKSKSQKAAFDVDVRQASEQSQISDFVRMISGSSCNTDGTTPSVHLTRSNSMRLSETGGIVLSDDVLEDAKYKAKANRLIPPNSAQSRLRQFKLVLFFFITAQMLVFGFWRHYMTPKTRDVIGLPILIARSSAYGACAWTGVLFLTMSRDLISFITRLRCVQRSQIAVQVINCHKEIHIFSAYEVLLNAFLHALMHHIGTFVALETHDTKKLNDMLACAQQKKNMPDGYIGKGIDNFLKAFQYPACPLPEDAEVGYFDGVFSTPGITGYLLLIVICMLGWFSRQKIRKTGFRLFYALHHLLVPAWVVLLVLHGANDWVGLGFPLVILVAGIPIVMYAWTRARRLYLSCRHAAQITKAEKSEKGNLLRLDVELKALYRTCQVGEFAYINVPSIGLMEWHPYTISNSKVNEDGSQKITFCIMAVGKWTNKLNNLFANVDERPTIHIDGPFYAPTVSMPNRSTVVGIGAGVGVTPFLSFLGSMVGPQASDHKNAHVFWMSAFATDFMLFQDLFGELEANAKAGGRNCTFHLHATPRFGAWDGKGMGSVFELASRDVWDQWLLRLQAKGANEKPSFSHYPKPLHAVVSTAMLQSGNPLAVVVGSPDFASELKTIGDDDLDEDVFVYFCGNPFLQNMIQTACIALNDYRERQEETQRYYFYFERFG